MWLKVTVRLQQIQMFLCLSEKLLWWCCKDFLFSPVGWYWSWWMYWAVLNQQNLWLTTVEDRPHPWTIYHKTSLHFYLLVVLYGLKLLIYLSCCHFFVLASGPGCHCNWEFQEWLTKKVFTSSSYDGQIWGPTIAWAESRWQLKQIIEYLIK